MIDDHALRRAFSDYADALIGRYEIGHVLYRLTDQVVEVLDVDGAGVSLGHGSDSLSFVTATDERVARLEDVQIGSEDGPCYDAFTSGDVVVCDDLGSEDRWPDYTPVALEQGFGAVVAIPMPVGGQRIGALDLYRHETGSWDRETLDVAQLLANVASGYVMNWQALEESRTLAGQLQHALDSRVVIEQAKGMVAARNGVDVGQAFETLRRHARSSSTRLHEVCRQVVAGDLEL